MRALSYFGGTVCTVRTRCQGVWLRLTGSALSRRSERLVHGRGDPDGVGEP